MEYLPKYGMVYTGTLILNGEQRIQKLSRKNIEAQIRAAVEDTERKG